jgi:glycosyltransferase domain-containing protein
MNNQHTKECDVTIIITTYNRYSCLYNLLRFYEKYNSNFKFLILDSSSKKTNINVILGKKLDIKYFKYLPKIKIQSKIYKGSVHIETKFCVLNADDDFLIPDSIIKAVNFLTRNNEYSSAHGKYLLVSEKIIPLIKKKILSLYLIKSYSSQNKEPIERIREYLSGDLNTYPFYAVHRSQDFKKIWKNTNKCTSDWGLNEIFPNALSLIIGKSKVLNNLYACRTSNFDQWYDEKRHRSMYSKSKIQLAITGLTSILFNIYNINKNETKKLIEILFDRYLKKTFHNKSLKLNRIEVLKKFCKKKKFLNFFFIILKNIKLFSINFFYLNHFSYYKDLRKIDLAFKSRDEAEILKSRTNYATFQK